MKKTLAAMSAATIYAVATAAHAGELADVQTQAKQPSKQDQALTKRIADLEKRQRKLESKVATQPAVAVPSASPFDAMAADFAALKAQYKKAPDDSLTWNGITLYGLVDMGITYQNHGLPLASTVGVNPVINKNANNSYFGLGPNSLSSSFIGLKGTEEIADGLSVIFNLQTGFDPASGRLSDGIGSVAGNNGLPVSALNSYADSAKNGELFNTAAYAGISSPIYGTLTYGRQNSLTSDGVINYDPMSSALAFSVIGYQGGTAGAGDTEQRILSNSLKYGVNLGPFRAAVEGALGSGNSSPRNVVQGQIGGDYRGLSLDAIFSHVQDAVSAAPLTSAQVLATDSLGIDQGSGFVSGTVSDNTAVMLLAKYTTGPVKLFGGYEHIQFANPSSPLSVGASLDGGYTVGVVNNTAYATDKILQMFWGGAKYAVRPDLDLMIAYYHEEQNSYEGGTAATLNASHCSDVSLAQCSGQLDAVSFVADYRFAKHFDTYAGIMWSQVSNGLASGFLQRSSIDPTVGLRFQF